MGDATLGGSLTGAGELGGSDLRSLSAEALGDGSSDLEGLASRLLGWLGDNVCREDPRAGHGEEFSGCSRELSRGSPPVETFRS